MVAGGAISGGWSPTDLHHRPEVVWWIGACAAAVGFVFLAAAVYPRSTRKDAREQLAYFGHVKQYRDKAELREALLNVPGDPFERVVDQVSAISKIIWSKYRAIRCALWSLGLAVVVCVGAVVSNRWY